MTAVSDLFAEVRGVAKRGTSLDGDLPYAFKTALAFLEQNYSWSYTLRVSTIVVAANATHLDLADTATRRMKAPRKLGYQTDAGDWVYLQQVEPGRFSSGEGEFPSGYVLTRTTTGWKFTFDCTLSEQTTFTLYAYYYTVWGGDETDTSIWAVNFARPALVARMMICLAPIMRDSAMQQMFTQLWLESITTLVHEDAERVAGVK